MRVNYVEVEIESVYDKSTARIKLSPDDVAGLIALAERLKALQPEKRATGSGGSATAAEVLENARRQRDSGCGIPAGVTHRHV